jgi:hypothetical protein
LFVAKLRRSTVYYDLLAQKDVDQRYDGETCENNDCIVLGGGFLLTHGISSLHGYGNAFSYKPPLSDGRMKCLPKTLEDMC